ncbi:hypothetical protein FRC10_010915 [Ceratobasidium sp. 414]|nr:hypothetical protein FRC10_010915 [Ceratobasidium sp. 414]
MWNAFMYPRPSDIDLEEKLPLLTPTRIDPEPTEWPQELSHLLYRLRTDIEGNPYDEDCWELTLPPIFKYFFPLAQDFSQGYQYPLRRPLTTQVPTQPAGSDVGADRGFGSSQVSVDPLRQGREHDDVCRPGMVIRHGFEPGDIKIVAAVEYRVSRNIGDDVFERFFKSAKRVVELGERASQAYLVLIAGGIVFDWRPDEIPALLARGRVDLCYLEERVKEGRSARADDVKFLQLVARMRNQFADWFNGLPEH